jgi:hypothetical protein
MKSLGESLTVLLALAGKRSCLPSMRDREAFERLAHSPLMRVILWIRTRRMSDDADFGRFDEMAARRDETGVVRLNR